MDKHIATLEEMLVPGQAGWMLPQEQEAIRAAIALMRGKSEMPVLFGRDSGGDWYMDADTKTISVDVDFDPSRQLSILLKQDGTVAWSIFVQEPDSSTTKATGPSVMNDGFYQALRYITDNQERDDA